MGARSGAARGRWARLGLAQRGPIDKTIQTMLLRQLYRSHYEARRFARARVLALQALELDVLADVLHQDAARAALGERDTEGALSHLRRAARCAPASRRAFHLWTLGSLLFLLHRYAESAAALDRAERWSGPAARPLYRAHRALVRIAMGERPHDLQSVVDELAAAPCALGYGRFVLGHLAYASGRWAVARRYLDDFVRASQSEAALAIALEGERQMAQTTMAAMCSN